MKDDKVRKTARIIVETCAATQKDETVLIIHDETADICARFISDAAKEMGISATLLMMSARDVDGEEPPETVAFQMKAYDVILMAVSKSLAHTTAVKRALAEGARVLSLTAISEALMVSRAFQADFIEQRPICEQVAKCFDQGETVQIRSASGTDLTTSACGRNGNAHCCLVERPSQFSSAPNIEANFSPLEGSAEGIFVADASIPYLGIGMLEQPVTFEIEKGRVITVRGGHQADFIADIWKKQNDPAVYNIAQVAVGLNPEILKPVGSLGCNYDEGAFGTVHIGIGTSANLGGNIKTSTHFDAVMNKPSLFVDGQEILKAGRLLI